MNSHKSWNAMWLLIESNQWLIIWLVLTFSPQMSIVFAFAISGDHDQEIRAVWSFSTLLSTQQVMFSVVNVLQLNPRWLYGTLQLSDVVKCLIVLSSNGFIMSKRRIILSNSHDILTNSYDILSNCHAILCSYSVIVSNGDVIVSNRRSILSVYRIYHVKLAWYLVGLSLNPVLVQCYLVSNTAYHVQLTLYLLKLSWYLVKLSFWLLRVQCYLVK